MEKKYGENNGLNDNPLFIKSLSNEEYLIVGRSITIIPSFLSDPWNSAYYIVHIDKGGNLLNEIHSQSGTKDGIVSELVYFETEEGEERLALASTILGVDALANDLTSKIRYLIIDMEGNIQDSISIGNNLSSFNYLSYNKRIDGGFLVAGQTAIEEFNRLSPIICKIDEKADTVWCSTPLVDVNTATLDQSFITGMQVLPSGSILLCGNYKNFGGDPNSTRPFIMKLDKDGCLEPGCRTVTSVTDQDIEDMRYSITPNPTSGRIQLATEQSGVLTLYSVTGVLLKTVSVNQGNNDIDISDIESGVIIYSVTIGTEIETGKLIKL